ncbi:MAG: peptidase S10 [Thermoanaerobaculia bacterium]
MRLAVRLFFILFLLSLPSFAQQTKPTRQRVEKTPQTTRSKQPAEQSPQTRHSEQTPAPESHVSAMPNAGGRDFHFDMTEQPPVVTHHTATVGGKTIHYTATAGRLPIKDAEGKIEAEMFFVAYTHDGAEAASRPLTFAFNGGPGSASLWLHMGALGPRKVALEPEGWLPPAPYHLTDNPYTPLDVTDLVVVDAIGTGYSRPADAAAGKKFWNLPGDIESFGEFIRLYISRYERWSSPLYLLGESYGTTRAAGISGYLTDRGINFTGIILLSEVLNFQTLEFAKTNDVPYPLIVPSYTMIAAYHGKLAPDLMQDLAKTRDEVTQWALGPYWEALNKGDALTPQERDAIATQLARYTGLTKQIADLANLRVDVGTFTHWLLADQKLRVGRLDARFTGPDPNGWMDTPFYDPSGGETTAPFTSTFYDYVRRDLGYKVDTPYYTSARQSGMFNWSWNAPAEGPRRRGDESGYPDTASALRAAMVKNHWLKVLVMEGYYDLATPFAAANYTMNHLDLPAEYRKNISYATYEAGHMVYLRMKSLEKFHSDVANFIHATSGQ